MTLNCFRWNNTRLAQSVERQPFTTTFARVRTAGGRGFESWGASRRKEIPHRVLANFPFGSGGVTVRRSEERLGERGHQPFCSPVSFDGNKVSDSDFLQLLPGVCSKNQTLVPQHYQARADKCSPRPGLLRGSLGLQKKRKSHRPRGSNPHVDTRIRVLTTRLRAVRSTECSVQM